MMVREIMFDVDTIKRMYVHSDEWDGWYDGRRLFAGYEGENEATQLSFTFGADFDGYTISLVFDVDGTATVVETATDDFDYEIPEAYMNAEVIIANVKAVLGTQILYSRNIHLEVKR